MIDTLDIRDYRNTKIDKVHRMFPWFAAIDTVSVTISDEAKATGSPKLGDMIAVNPKDRTESWLVTEQEFKADYEQV